MTTEEYFKDLSSKLEITKVESDKISSKHNNLRESLREKLAVEDDFLTGSYMRNTLIRPKGKKEKFDVDFFLVFNNEDYGSKELPELLAMVKVALEDIKKQDEDIIEIKEQKRSLGVIYKDNFQIDVVPAIQIKKDELYKIFDKRTFKAVNSNPKLHGEILTKANDDTESGSVKRLVPIVKLLKAWKREKCDYLKSFHLEILTVTILGDEEIKTFSEGLSKFFLNVEDYLKEARLKDPSNEENIIDEYLDENNKSDRNTILSLIKQEIEAAKKAREYEKAGKDEKALDEWKKIFSSEEQNTSKAIKEGKFYHGNGGVIIKTNPRSADGKRIDSPKSWRE